MRARIAVYVTPRSSREEIAGVREDELHLRVTVPPEDGKANMAACRLLAKELGVPKSSVRVARGDTSRHKQLEIDGVGDDRTSALLDSYRAE